MSYSLDIHPKVNDDVLEIFLSIDEDSSLQADLFAENILLEYEKLLSELNKNFFHQSKRPIKSRPVGKFKNHLIFYTVNPEREKVMVLAIAYGGRSPDTLAAIINGRL